MRAFVVLLVVVVGSFSGCVDRSAPLDSTDAVEAAPLAGTAASTSITAADPVAAPVWTVGTWFGHHVFFGADDQEGQHYNTIVTRDDGDSYFLASDDESAAKDEAAFDIPILGPVRKTDLHVTGLGGQWDLFRFPMKDGSTWKSTFTVAMDESFSYEVTHVATFNPAIETPYGPRPGFDIVAHTSDHEQLLSYDYVPDLGWYAHLFVFELATPEPDDFLFHVMSMGRGTGWTGSYYVYESTTMLQAVRGFAPSENFPPEMPPNVFAEPEPLLTFTMAEGSTLLYGFVYGYAVAGAEEIVLVDPNGGHHEFQAIGAPEGEDGSDIELPAIAGEWKLLSAGAGVVWIEVAYLWQLTAAHGEL
jgi:hypothetical protein